MLYPGLFPGVTPYRHDGESPVVPGHLACTFRLPAGPCTKEPPDRFDACAIRRLQSFLHVIVLSATRRIRARLSGLSELFLNNCRVVSASLMEVNLINVKFNVKMVLFMKVKFDGERKQTH